MRNNYPTSVFLMLAATGFAASGGNEEPCENNCEPTYVTVDQGTAFTATVERKLDWEGELVTNHIAGFCPEVAYHSTAEEEIFLKTHNALLYHSEVKYADKDEQVEHRCTFDPETCQSHPSELKTYPGFGPTDFWSNYTIGGGVIGINPTWDSPDKYFSRYEIIQHPNWFIRGWQQIVFKVHDTTDPTDAATPLVTLVKDGSVQLAADVYVEPPCWPESFTFHSATEADDMDAGNVGYTIKVCASGSWIGCTFWENVLEQEECTLSDVPTQNGYSDRIVAIADTDCVNGRYTDELWISLAELGAANYTGNLNFPCSKIANQEIFSTCKYNDPQYYGNIVLTNTIEIVCDYSRSVGGAIIVDQTSVGPRERLLFEFYYNGQHIGNRATVAPWPLGQGPDY